MRKLFCSMVVLVSLFAASPAQAAPLTPLAVAVIPPVQFPPTDFTVAGARASILWGNHRSVYGVDLGVIGNTTSGQFTGIGVSGLFNYNRGTATILGLQLAGITNVNVNKARIFGVQAAAGMNSNKAESTLVGLQVSLANHSPFMDVWGLQVGLYNRAKIVRGFQIGIVNVAETLKGIQIGLINFNRTGLFSVAPILNIGF